MTDGDDRYVHDPAAFDERDERADESSTGEEDSLTGVPPDAVDREFDWRGWVLVGVMVVAFVLAPIAIYLVPPGASEYRFALIILPLLPALLLAVTAVWATTRP